ncbi:hypothetical protein E4U54_003579, partial [Claviceps lovelessii]
MTSDMKADWTLDRQLVEELLAIPWERIGQAPPIATQIQTAGPMTNGQLASTWFFNDRIQIPECRFQSADSRFQISDLRFQIPDFRVQTT